MCSLSCRICPSNLPGSCRCQQETSVLHPPGPPQRAMGGYIRGTGFSTVTGPREKKVEAGMSNMAWPQSGYGVICVFFWVI